jgi:hypothetical protein
MNIPALQPSFIPSFSPTQFNADAPAADPVAAAECATCANRFYQDDSPDGGVSMQSPTRIHPSEAASAVMGHEREHQARNARAAAQDGREVISNTVRLHTSLCPECGQVFVSGGETRTVTAERSNENVMSFENAFSNMKI